MKFIAFFRVLVLFITLLGISSVRADGYTVLVMGDSISAAYGLEMDDGWVNLAQETLQNDGLDVELINASITGDTSTGGLRRLPDAIDRFQPNLLVIELGGNDGLRGYPPSALQKNLEAMANFAQSKDVDVLILGMVIPSNYGPAYRKMFTDAFTSAAANTNSALLPFILEPIATEREFFQADGIHPTAEAQPLIMEHTLPSIRAFIDDKS